jgi:hypothetical protein
MFTAGTRLTMRSEKKVSLKMDSKTSPKPGISALFFLSGLNLTNVMGFSSLNLI